MQNTNQIPQVDIYSSTPTQPNGTGMVTFGAPKMPPNVHSVNTVHIGNGPNSSNNQSSNISSFIFLRIQYKDQKFTIRIRDNIILKNFLVDLHSSGKIDQHTGVVLFNGSQIDQSKTLLQLGLKSRDVITITEGIPSNIDIPLIAPLPPKDTDLQEDPKPDIVEVTIKPNQPQETSTGSKPPIAPAGANLMVKVLEMQGRRSTNFFIKSDLTFRDLANKWVSKYGDGNTLIQNVSLKFEERNISMDSVLREKGIQRGSKVYLHYSN